ncbi:hypothetical protein KY285_023527 [Solanum tuberosum]|nr:hypothetical protein KY289_023862 [Solanum tuberosum]KAH0675726.1 hypothetical protein KY285_023527 [Solanum tuberosum]
MPDSDVFKHALDSSHIHLSQDGDEGEANEDVTQNPWKTGTYQQTDEGKLIGVDSPPSLRRSTRIRKQNSKITNAAIVEDEN